MTVKNLLRAACFLTAIFLIIYISFVILTSMCYGLSVGTAANSSYSITLNQALNEKKTISRSYQVNKEIAVYTLYVPFLAYLEMHNRYFKKCHIITAPPTLDSFLSNQNEIYTRYGINTYAVDLLQKKGELGGGNNMLSQSKIKHYMVCVATYGLIIAQAFADFNNSLHNGAGAVMSNNVYHVPNDSFYNLVGGSLYNAIVRQNLRLKTEFQTIKNEILNYPCVLYNKSLKCGGVYLNIENYPVLSFGGLDWYNPQSDFAGANDMVEIGYNKNAEMGLTADKGKAINHLDENTNTLTNDLLNSIF